MIKWFNPCGKDQVVFVFKTKMNAMELIHLVLLFVVGVALLSYFSFKSEIKSLSFQLDESRRDNVTLFKQKEDIQKLLDENIRLTEFETNWCAENLVILTGPEDVQRFLNNCDGLKLHKLNLKISIYRDKEKMIKELREMFLKIEPCFKTTNKFH